MRRRSSAGLNAEIVLLEEPQAAVYAWLSAVGERWRRMLKLGDRLLVCDIGGGTTDLTLIAVDEEHGDLVLRRLAVGDHLLVGGDNMDLALAHHVAGQFAEQGIQLDPWQSVALWHSCRAAKETTALRRGRIGQTNGRTAGPRQQGDRWYRIGRGRSIECHPTPGRRFLSPVLAG